MKNISLFVILFTALWSTSGFGQAVFGVSPGLGFNSAYLGIQVNDNFIPYLSMQYLGVHYLYEEEDYQEELNASAIVPTLGAKLFLGGSGPIRSYLNGSISKPLITGKLQYDGEPDEEFADAVDNISVLGAEVGFGVEYFFDARFSIGGEFGIRFVSGKFEVDDEFDPYSVKAGVTPTYTKISFNYYFAAKEE